MSLIAIEQMMHLIGHQYLLSVKKARNHLQMFTYEIQHRENICSAEQIIENEIAR